MSYYNGLSKNKNKQESHNGLDIVHGDGSLVAKSCPTLCNTMDCSPPGSSVRGISQVRILELLFPPPAGIFPTQGSNPHLLHLAGRFFTTEPPGKSILKLERKRCTNKQINKKNGLKGQGRQILGERCNKEVY